MARRSIERTFVDLALSGVGIALIGIAVLVMLLREYPVQMLVLTGLVVGTWHYLKNRKTQKRASELESAVHRADQQIERHRSALIGYYRQSLRWDQFGNEDASVWRKWITTFVQTKVRPELLSSRIPVNDTLLEQLGKHVDGCVRDMARFPDTTDQAPNTLTGLDYERKCASSLFHRGWTVHPTPKTGDHGADVVAEKGGKRLVVQCKLYSQPVGNKAVQEVYSALRLYDGTHACVVAPNGFTAQAERAAEGLSVNLLHHSQLEAFADALTNGGCE